MPKHEATLMGRPYYIPDYMGDGIDLYVNEGIKPGGFLQAVICNDLKEAFAKADDVNFHNIAAYADYFYNHTPAICWGSREKMEAWVKTHSERRKKDVEQST
ncbi:MAG: hypothetical protein JRJ39_00550 [Deltaproteobacteria bacterium]|nr:hypothetical protein [Deltaproteobacteria bacterium]MBW1845599.1 hypothetical protein [Deltaproteobacteria bacterium]MBW2032027.1 hypothetical protein [Deltaproteobacteria bacterium]